MNTANSDQGERTEPAVSEKFVLKILSGVHRGAEIDVLNGSYTIGSGLDNDVVLSDCDIRETLLELILEEGVVSIEAAPGVPIWNTDEPSPTENTCVLQPFRPVLVGNLVICIGYHPGDWAEAIMWDFSLDHARKVVDANAVAEGLDSMSVQKTPRVFLWSAAAALVLCACVAISWNSMAPQSSETASVPITEMGALTATREFLTMHGMSKLEINERKDMFEVSGRLAKNDELVKLQAFIKNWPRVAIGPVVVDEALINALSYSLVALGEETLEVRKGSEPGAFEVHGFSGNLELWRELSDQLKSDVVGVEELILVRMESENPMVWLARELKLAGLGHLFATLNGTTVVIAGDTEPDSHKAWERIERAFKEKFGPEFVLQKEKELDVFSFFEIRGIRYGENPYLITRRGLKIPVGGKIDENHRLISISRQVIRVEKEGMLQEFVVGTFDAQ